MKKYISAILIIFFALAIVAGSIMFAPDNTPKNITQESTKFFNTPFNLGLFSNSETTESLTEETTEESSTVTETVSETTEAPTKYAESDDKSKIYFTNYRFSTVEPDYFDDAIFIGNSRMQGFILYSKLENLRAYSYIGFSPKSYFTKYAFTVDGVDMTTAQAMENETNFSKVYIKFGINEVSYMPTSQFIEAYSKVIEHIYSCNPNAIIYVISVLPISDKALIVDPGLTHERISEYNMELQNMAAKYSACYLDVSSTFSNEEGKMPDELASDGIHLNPSGIQMWLQYFLEHGIEEN